MALNTCEASTFPDEQALPALTATPGKIEPDDQGLGLGAGNREAARIGSRATRPDSTTVSGSTPSALFSNSSRSAASSEALSTSAAASSAATPKPTMPATFSVPARRRRSWPPPLIRGSTGHAFAEHESADALGSADLVRRKRHHVGAKRAEIERQPAGDLNRIGMQNTARRMDDLGCGSDRLDGAGFVVGRHQRNEGPPPSEMVFGKLFLKHAEVDNAIARHGNSGRALAIEPASGEHRRMLNRRHVAVPGFAGLRGKRERIRLAAAAREDHILRLGVRPSSRPSPARLRRAPSPPCPRHAPRTDCRACPRRQPWRRAPPAEAELWRCSRDTNASSCLRSSRTEGAAVSACTSPHRACYEARPEAWTAPSP